MKKEGAIKIYEGENGNIKVEIRLRNETVWLTQKQISEIFGKDVRTINEHIQNIFSTKELDRDSTVRKIRIVGNEGKRQVARQIDHYNLDVILSVGYRVNSKKATAFRIWANQILKNYLVKGYAINEKKFIEAKSIVQFITEKAKNAELSGHEKEILDVIERYSKTWKVLGEYDEGEIKIAKTKKAKYQLNYYQCQEIIERLKDDLITKKIVGDLFGHERSQALEGIIGNLYQTFGGEELYDSIEEKAAHLLYFVIKDHPFSDGNKRIGSLLFLHFMHSNNFLFKKNGAVKIADKTLVALALLVATSAPREKDAIVRLAINLIQD